MRMCLPVWCVRMNALFSLLLRSAADPWKSNFPSQRNPIDAKITAGQCNWQTSSIVEIDFTYIYENMGIGQHNTEK